MKKSNAIDDFKITESLSEIGRVLMLILLLPVYLFMMLYYKSLFLHSFTNFFCYLLR